MAAHRMTLQIQAVLQVFLSDPARRRYGLELCEETGLPAGTVYPILARLEGAGWLETHWEDPGARSDEGRPRRRYYTITRDGAESARQTIARTQSSRHHRLLGWVGPAEGTS